MADRIQYRRDTKARWAQYNPILLEGEVGYELDTDQYKVGNGQDAWNSLPYRGDPCLDQMGTSKTTPMSQDAVRNTFYKRTSFVLNGNNINNTVYFTTDGKIKFNSNGFGIFNEYNQLTVWVGSTATPVEDFEIDVSDAAPRKYVYLDSSKFITPTGRTNFEDVFILSATEIKNENYILFAMGYKGKAFPTTFSMPIYATNVRQDIISLRKTKVTFGSGIQNNRLNIVANKYGDVTITGGGFKFYFENGNEALTVTESNGDLKAPSYLFPADKSKTYAWLLLDLTKVPNGVPDLPATIWGGIEDLYYVVNSVSEITENHLVLCSWYQGNLTNYGLLSADLQTYQRNNNSGVKINPYLNNKPIGIKFNNFYQSVQSIPSEEIVLDTFMFTFNGVVNEVHFDTPKILSNEQHLCSVMFVFNVNKALNQELSCNDEGIRTLYITDANFSEYFYVMPATATATGTGTGTGTNFDVILLQTYKGMAVDNVGAFYDFFQKSILPPNFLFPTAMAETYDSQANFIKGAMRLIDNKLVITAKSAFYVYNQSRNAGNTTFYLFRNNSDEDIIINMSVGDTVCLDLSEAVIGYGSVALNVGTTIKVLQYNAFNSLQIPICQRRTAHVIVNPTFIWTLFYDKIAGSSQGDWAIIGTNGVANIQDNVLTVGAQTSLFIYRNTGMNGAAAYLRLNAVGKPFTFDFNSVNSISTLVIDGTKLTWMSDDISINDLSEITKVVSGRNYSTNDIPIAHVRSGKLFIHPTFQSIFASSEETDEVFMMNKTNFLQWYSSVCRAKRGDLSTANRWVNRCNVLFLTDNHATNTDGYKNIREAVRLANMSNSMVNAIVDTGDLTNGFGTGVAKQTVINTLQNVRDIFLTGKITTLALLGNHDANDYGGDPNIALTKQEQWDAIFQGLSEKWTSVVFGDKEDYRHYSYYDISGDDFGLIRIIMLDQLDHDLITDSQGKLIYTSQNDPVYSQKQMDWLCNVALQVPDGAGVIICNHYPFDYTPTSDKNQSLIIDGKYVQPWTMIPEIVQAWQNRTTLNKTFNDSVGSQNITINVDFSNIGADCEFITYLCGHTHFKTTKVVTGFKQMMLLEDASGSYGTGYSWTSRLSGTVTSNCFSILSIDRTLKKIFRSNYGAWKTVNEDSKNRIDIIDYVVE